MRGWDEGTEGKLIARFGPESVNRVFRLTYWIIHSAFEYVDGLSRLTLPYRLLGGRFGRFHREEFHLTVLTATRPRHEQSFFVYAQLDQLIPAGVGALLRELVLDLHCRFPFEVCR